MRIVIFALTLGFSCALYAREWKNLRQYQRVTQKAQLSPSDWLTSDRTLNTLVWDQANRHNLNHDRPQEYQSLKQRRDFYIWLDGQFKSIGHEVAWQKMAYFISRKLRLLESFPHCMLAPKKIRRYADEGSALVFNNAFESLKELLNSSVGLLDDEALTWDKKMLHDEQYVWLEAIYKKMDARSINQIQRMANGRFLYALGVPKEIRFEGDISNPDERYDYALNILRPYCLNLLK